MSTRTPSRQRAFDQIRRHRRARYAGCRAPPSSLVAAVTRSRARLEPFAHVAIEPDAVHVVVQRFSQCCAKHVVIDASGVREVDVVVRECGMQWRRQRDSILFRMLADRRMYGAGEPMKEARLYATSRE